MIQLRKQYGNLYVKIVSVGELFDSVMSSVLNIPGRSYDQETGEWMFNTDSLERIIETFGNHIIWGNPLEEIVEGEDISSEVINRQLSWEKNEVFKDFKIDPYPYQKTGSHFLASRGTAAVFDGVGLGRVAL